MWFISAMQSVLGTEGIIKNFKNVLEDDGVIIQVNVDGVQGKESLRKYTSFHEALIGKLMITPFNICNV